MNLFSRFSLMGDLCVSVPLGVDGVVFTQDPTHNLQYESTIKHSEHPIEFHQLTS